MLTFHFPLNHYWMKSQPCKPPTNNQPTTQRRQFFGVFVAGDYADKTIEPMTDMSQRFFPPYTFTNVQGDFSGTVVFDKKNRSAFGFCKRGTSKSSIKKYRENSIIFTIPFWGFSPYFLETPTCLPDRLRPVPLVG